MSKFKVATLTWYAYKNYGTALQASALTNCLNKLGCDVSMIAYSPKGNIPSTKRITLADYFKKAFEILKNRENRVYSSPERDRLFNLYIKERIVETEECKTFPELRALSREFDAVVCGSDQIWSPLCYDSKYFLDFVEDTDKMIAYAPSIGSTKVENPTIRERMAKLISRFTHLSVRELQGAEIIKELTGREAKVVLDPTLLMNAEEWDRYIKVEQAPRLKEEKYIVCYFLGNSDKYMSYVRALSEKMGVPFYLIPVTERQKKSREALPFEVGPREFVSLIKNAAFVCTDSYHGMAFSINYNVPFSTFKRFEDKDKKNQNSRIFSLLKLLGMEDRVVYYKAKPKTEIFSCDFSVANGKLIELREKSLSYLSNALQKAKSDEKRGKWDFKITERCCGCGACAAVCGKKAISVKKNSEGFDHYFIDGEKCVGCGLCKSVCPMNEVIAQNLKEAKALYAIKSKNDRTLNKSSSGGVGYELASLCLEKGYAVSGCAYDKDNNKANHIWIMPDETDRLSLIQGSKYIQSETYRSLNEAQGIIKDRKVAFFGTPCQAAGLDKLLRERGLRDRALIVDLICHGVPTAHLWDKYLSDVDKKYDTGKNPDVLFRKKDYGWRNRFIEIAGNDCVYRKNEKKDDFYAFFRRGLCDMKSCSDCPYRERSAADIRIGDYWGPKFTEDTEGVSMVIANTEMGYDAVCNLANEGKCQLLEFDLGEYWTVQYPYNANIPLVREELIKELKASDSSLHSLRNKYCKYYDQVEQINRILNFFKKLTKKEKSNQDKIKWD